MIHKAVEGEILRSGISWYKCTAFFGIILSVPLFATKYTKNPYTRKDCWHRRHFRLVTSFAPNMKQKIRFGAGNAWVESGWRLNIQ